MKRIMVVGLVLGVGLVCGCRKSVSVTGPDGTKTTYSKSGKNMEIKVEGKDGGTVQIAGGEGGVALPEGFPKDVPVYPGAKVLSTMKAAESVCVMLQTSDAKDKVLAFYKEKLKANGFEIKQTMDAAEGAMLMSGKGGLSLTTSIAVGEGTTNVTLIVANEEKQP